MNPLAADLLSLAIAVPSLILLCAPALLALVCVVRELDLPENER